MHSAKELFVMRNVSLNIILRNVPQNTLVHQQACAMVEMLQRNKVKVVTITKKMDVEVSQRFLLRYASESPVNSN